MKKMKNDSIFGSYPEPGLTAGRKAAENLVKNLPGLVIQCANCWRPLEQPGGLVFSPPDKEGKTKKFHLCVECFAKLLTMAVVNWRQP